MKNSISRNIINYYMGNKLLVDGLNLVEKASAIFRDINNKYTMPLKIFGALSMLFKSSLSEENIKKIYDLDKMNYDNDLILLSCELLIKNLDFKRVILHSSGYYFEEILFYKDKYTDENIIICRSRSGSTDLYNLYCNEKYLKEVLCGLFWKNNNFIEFKILRDKIVFKEKVIKENIMSKNSEKILKELDKCNRSYLFFGSPGVGKSYDSKYIVKQKNYKTIFLPISKLNSLSSTFMCDVVQLFSPEAIIIDDIDRLNNSEKMLSLLEELNLNLKLLVASANDISKLDPALIRPGRFDSLIEVSTTDKNVLDTILEKYSDKSNELEGLPASYAIEYVKLRDLDYDHEKALEQIKKIIILANPNIQNKSKKNLEDKSIGFKL